MAIIIEYFFIICYNNNMFNWFKNKVELKNNNSIMSSFFNRTGVKIGSELIVPTNFKALIYYNEKLFYTLDSGKHKIDKQDMSSLIDSQQRNKKKIKNIKFVCHYINTLHQNFELKLKKQTYLINFYVDDIIKFANFMLLYTFKVDSDYVFYNLQDIFGEILTYNNHDCSKISKTSLVDYGIIIESFAPAHQKTSIFNTTEYNLPKQNSPINQSTFTSTQSVEQNNNSSLNTNQVNILTQTQNSKPENNNQVDTLVKTNSSNNLLICPNCKNISKFNTTYCLKCGYKLE